MFLVGLESLIEKMKAVICVFWSSIDLLSSDLMVRSRILDKYNEDLYIPFARESGIREMEVLAENP
jgi:hypothetical protein